MEFIAGGPKLVAEARGICLRGLICILAPRLGARTECRVQNVCGGLGERLLDIGHRSKLSWDTTEAGRQHVGQMWLPSRPSFVERWVVNIPHVEGR